MDTLYQKNFALINYNQHKDILTLHLIREVKFADYKIVLKELLDKLHDKQPSRLILDQRYAEDLNMEERAWFVTQWFPRLTNIVTQANFKMVIISSKSLFEKIGSDYIVKTLRNTSKFPINNVDSMEEALKWLNS